MSPILKPFPKISDIIYGPVESRRLGRSLGINVLSNGPKLCSFNCGYCQLGWTKRRVGSAATESGLPSPEEIGHALRDRLLSLRRQKVVLDRITFSGNGEPTAHPRFDEIVEEVVRIRDELAPQVWIAALTNGAHVDRPDVLRGLDRCNERIIKLDAGNEKMFRRINQPRAGLRLDDMVARARRIRGLTIQSMFVTGAVDNTGVEDVESWIDRLREIQPAWIQMYTIARLPAHRKLEPVSSIRLMEIAMRVLDRCQVEPLVIFPE